MRAWEWQIGFQTFLKQPRSRQTILTTLLHINDAKAMLSLLDGAGLGELKQACCEGLQTYDREMFAFLRRSATDEEDPMFGHTVPCQQFTNDTFLKDWMWTCQYLDSFAAFVVGYCLLRSVSEMHGLT